MYNKVTSPCRGNKDWNSNEAPQADYRKAVSVVRVTPFGVYSRSYIFVDRLHVPKAR